MIGEVDKYAKKYPEIMKILEFFSLCHIYSAKSFCLQKYTKKIGLLVDKHGKGLGKIEAGFF